MTALEFTNAVKGNLLSVMGLTENPFISFSSHLGSRGQFILSVFLSSLLAAFR